jgi:hypothetical protein
VQEPIAVIVCKLVRIIGVMSQLALKRRRDHLKGSHSPGQGGER